MSGVAAAVLALALLALWPALAAAAAIAAMRRRAETRALEERLARLEAELRRMRLGKEETPAAPPPQDAQPKPPAPAPARLPRPEPPPPSAARHAPSEDLEERIGARWATWVGVVVTVFGVGLFVRWTIQNDLIGPAARVILGLLAGASLLAGGLSLHRKRALPYLSQGLAGGGLALLYLPLFAAHAVYGFLGPAAAFSAMSAVTLAGILVAVATARQATAVLALAGGLLTPILVSAERPDERVLLAYLIVLDLLVLGVARWRVWPGLSRLGWAGSVLLLVPPFARAGAVEAPVARLALLTVLFLLFVAAPLLRPWIAREPARRLDLALVVGNAAGYMTAVYVTLERWRPALEAPYAVALAAFYLAAARAYRRRMPADSPTIELHLGNAAVLLALAFPLALDGPWVTAAWAAQGAVFFLLAPRLARSTTAVAGGMSLLIAAACRAGLLDRVWYEVSPPVFNVRFLVGLFAVAAFAVAGHRARAIEPDRHALRTSGKELRAALWLLGAVLLAVLFWTEPPGLWPALLLAAETVALAAFARRTGEPALARPTPVLAGILLARTLLADHPLARDAAESLVNRPLLARIAAAGAIALAGSWLRRAPARAGAGRTGRALQAVSAAALLVSLSAGWVLHQDAMAREAVAEGAGERLAAVAWRRLAGLSVLWTLYAVAVLVWGFLRSSRLARYAALGLLGIVVVKVFAVDLSEVQAIYRVASFLVLGVVLLGVSAAYQKLRGRQRPPASPLDRRP